MFAAIGLMEIAAALCTKTHSPAAVRGEARPGGAPPPPVAA